MPGYDYDVSGSGADTSPAGKAERSPAGKADSSPVTGADSSPATFPTTFPAAAGPQRGPDGPGAGPRRRDFLRYSGGAAAASGLAGAIAGSGLLTPAAARAATVSRAATGAPAREDATATPSAGYAAADGNLAATPIRPPAAPLVVRGPYVSTWLPSTALPGTWQEFW